MPSCTHSWTATIARSRRRRPGWKGSRRSRCRAARRTAAWCSRTVRSRTSKLDFNTLQALGEEARAKAYGLAGAVQHGASTLPESAFHNFPRVETAEIHLATGFQNMLYDGIPAALREEIYAWLRVQRGRGAQGRRLRRAVHLQDAQEGARPVQGKVLGDRRAMSARRSIAVSTRNSSFSSPSSARRKPLRTSQKFVTTSPMHRPAPVEGADGMTAAPDDPDAGE